MKPKFKTPQEALRYHVTGAIERGEGEAIVGIPAASKAAPTPGPWYIEAGTGLKIRSKERRLAIARMGDRDLSIDEDARIQSANARLIAAAPELFNALSCLTRSCRMKGPHGINLYAIGDNNMAMARAAIAKAQS